MKKRIIIKKNIPSEAGLGGASADAAAVLEASDRADSLFVAGTGQGTGIHVVVDLMQRLEHCLDQQDMEVVAARQDDLIRVHDDIQGRSGLHLHHRGLIGGADGLPGGKVGDPRLGQSGPFLMDGDCLGGLLTVDSIRNHGGTGRIMQGNHPEYGLQTGDRPA